MKPKKTTTSEVPFFIDEANRQDEGVGILVTKGEAGEWVGRTLTFTNDEGNTVRIAFYILPQDESAALVLCPLGESEWLSDLVSSLNEYNVKGATNAWPLLMAALKNGNDDNYSHSDAPALIHIADVPTGESNVWGVAVKVENIDYEDLDTEYLYKKVAFAFKYAIEMLKEYKENDISTTDITIATGKQTYNTWRKAKTIAKVASFALSVLGLGVFSDLGDLTFGEDA